MRALAFDHPIPIEGICQAEGSTGTLNWHIAWPLGRWSTSLSARTALYGQICIDSIDWDGSWALEHWSPELADRTA
jgi:hypothetical protein